MLFLCNYLGIDVELTEERELLPERMAEKLMFKYDREADILHIDKCPPYAGQESEEIGDDIVARLNPQTNEIENLEVLFSSARLLRSELFELPVTAAFQFAGRQLSGLT